MVKLKARHAISIGVLFSIGSIIINMGFNEEYLIQKLFISFVVSCILIIFYQYLLNKNPNKNLYQIINEKLNKVTSKIVIFLMLALLLFCSVQIIYSFIDFITTINQLDFLSKNMIMLLNFILLGYILKNKIYNLGRFTQVIFVLTIAMIFLLFILGIKDINYKNLFPFYTLKTNEFFNNYKKY
jgi:spore germination protein KB